MVTIRSEIGEFNAKVPVDRIRSVFDGKIGSVVEFSIDAVLSPENRVRRIQAVHYVDLIEDGPDVERLSGRLSEFKSLNKGWLEGAGEPVNEEAAKVSLDLAKFINASFEGVRVYPTPQGGVQLEYDVDDVDVTIRVSSSRKIEMHALDLQTDRLLESRYRGLTDTLLSDIMNLREKVESSGGK
jgi:hypothetical protein